jgi:hypothetical protein
LEQEFLYMKGFNAGYIVHSRIPELAEVLISATVGNSIYLEGLKDGCDQFQIEKVKDLEYAKLKSLNLARIRAVKKNKDKGLDLEP